MEAINLDDYRDRKLTVAENLARQSIQQCDDYGEPVAEAKVIQFRFRPEPEDLIA